MMRELSDEIPDWNKQENEMPESQSLVKLSWEDIYPYAFNRTKEHDRLPTVDEIKAIFDNITEADWDCECSTFWNQVDYEVDEFYNEVFKKVDK